MTYKAENRVTSKWTLLLLGTEHSLFNVIYMFSSNALHQSDTK